MAIEYRPPREEELADFAYTSNIGFGGTTREADVQRSLESSVVRPEWRLGAFDNGKVVSQIATFPFHMHWSGCTVRCGGITSVSTLPSHRRRGLLRELMARTLTSLHDDGVPLAMLWASMAAIYQRFGFGVIFTRWEYEFDPALLRFVGDPAIAGHTRMVKDGDAVPLLARAYVPFAEPRTAMLQRDSPELGDWWNRFVLRGWSVDRQPWLIAVYEERDEVLGYVIYDVQQRPDERNRANQLVAARELVWQTHAAHRALVSFLAAHDLAGAVRIGMLPADDPLFLQVQEPRWLNAKALDGTLLRIVDVQTALAQRRYPADGRLRFAVADDLCPWNAGTWELHVEAGSATVRRSSEPAQIELDMRALAVLASGHRAASELTRAGLIAVQDPRALETADALFRSACSPLCLDSF